MKQFSLLEMTQLLKRRRKVRSHISFTPTTCLLPFTRIQIHYQANKLVPIATMCGLQYNRCFKKSVRDTIKWFKIQYRIILTTVVFTHTSITMANQQGYLTCLEILNYLKKSTCVCHDCRMSYRQTTITKRIHRG